MWGDRYAYRVMYELVIGPCDGLDLHHRCENKVCVNPWHLEPLTPLEHGERHGRGMRGYKPDKCPAGHEYSEANTYVYTNKRGKPERYCRTCRRDRMYAREGKGVRRNGPHRAS